MHRFLGTCFLLVLTHCSQRQGALSELYPQSYPAPIALMRTSWQETAKEAQASINTSDTTVSLRSQVERKRSTLPLTLKTAAKKVLPTQFQKKRDLARRLRGQRVKLMSLAKSKHQRRLWKPTAHF